MDDDDQPKFEQQDSGVPVTPPDRNPDPLQPEHSVPEGAGGRDEGTGGDREAGSPAEHVRDQRAGDPDADEPMPSVEGGPATTERKSGLQESNPAEGL
jgi:hypothetical protein